MFVLQVSCHIDMQYFSNYWSDWLLNFKDIADSDIAYLCPSFNDVSPCEYCLDAVLGNER